LEKKGWWSEEKDQDYLKQVRKDVLKAFSAAEKVKKPSIDLMFTDVYKEVPAHLKRQQTELKEHLAQYGEHYPLNTFKS
ncbi:UNVERIFIED_CONTAM: 2-oxoisovalerate dehydrogenase subunit alpha, mitochondrial, partial [Eudyptes robustus]